MTPKGNAGGEGGVPSRMDLLELDLDMRLTLLWAEVQHVEEWNLDVVSAFIRAAYGKGYVDALSEPKEDAGSLARDHGFRVPRRGE